LSCDTEYSNLTCITRSIQMRRIYQIAKLACLTAIAYTTESSAQTNVVLTGDVGGQRVPVGRLFSEDFIQQSYANDYVSVITSGGYVLFLLQQVTGAEIRLWVANYYPFGELDTTWSEHIQHVYFENTNCTGASFIDLCEGVTSCGSEDIFDHRGHIEYVFGGDQYPVLYSVGWNEVPQPRTAYGQIDVTGACEEIFYPILVEDSVLVKVINPPDYGLTYDGRWYVKQPQWNPQLPELMSCSGFESCPVP